MDDRHMHLAAFAHGAGSGAALPQLCEFLAHRGLLTSAEIEILRHHALLGFDELRLRKELSAEEIEILDTGRSHTEVLWHRASLAASAQD